jgi:hypothetical protein
MQAGLEGRRTTQLWRQTNTGTRSLDADNRSAGVSELFPDFPSSFELKELMAARSIRGGRKRLEQRCRA